MVTNKELEVQVDTLKERVSQLATANSQLLDEVSTLKHNFNKVVEDVNVRLEGLHNKLFRK